MDGVKQSFDLNFLIMYLFKKGKQSAQSHVKFKKRKQNDCFLQQQVNVNCIITFTVAVLNHKKGAKPQKDGLCNRISQKLRSIRNLG